MTELAYILAGMHICFAVLITLGQARSKSIMVAISLAIAAVLFYFAETDTALPAVMLLGYLGIGSGRVFTHRMIAGGTGDGTSSHNDDFAKVAVRSLSATGIPIAIVGAPLALLTSFTLAMVLVAWSIAAIVDFCLRFDF